MEETFWLNNGEKQPQLVRKRNSLTGFPQDYDDSSISWKDIKPQVTSSIVIALALSHAGLSVSFPNLLANSEAKKYFATVSALLTPLGSVLLNLTSDRLGRKKCLIFLLLICVVSWLLISFSVIDTYLFYTGSVLIGVTRGALTAHSSTYISEITNSHYRQMFLSLTTLFFTFGFLILGVFDLITTWQNAALSFACLFIFEIILVILFVWESPQWYGVINKDFTKAEWVLRKYNPKLELFEKERAVLQEKIASMARQAHDEKPSVFRLMLTPGVYRPSIILIILLLYQQSCGLYPFSAYTKDVTRFIVPIFDDTSCSFVLLITGITRLLISIATTIFLKMFNQKQLMIVSALGMLLPSILIILLTCFGNRLEKIQWSDWIIVSSFILYITFGCIGINGIPWTLIFELLPTEIRGALGPYFVGFGYLFMAAQLNIFKKAYDVLGTVYLFTILGMINLLGTFFIFFAVPETRGKTLHDLEKRYSKGKKSVP